MNKINAIGPAVLSLDVEIKAWHTLNSTLREQISDKDSATNCGQQDNSIEAQPKAP